MLQCEVPRLTLTITCEDPHRRTFRTSERDKRKPMAEIPEKYLDLLQDKKSFAHLATIMPDGTPQVTPVWFDYTNGKIRINSAKGRVKSRNMSEGAPVALSILDPDNAYRYIQIRGRVDHVTEEGADAHIDSLAKKYLDKDKYPWASPDQIRVIFEIEPDKVQVMG
jgi:PPOX class probable F420-dependent enzyme